MLNLHERWLLRLVGLRRTDRRALLGALADSGQARGEVDLTAQVGGYTLAKRSITSDLEPLFDRLTSRYEISVDRVAFGDRRYRKQVILAAALYQAGVSAAGYRIGSAAGCRTLSEYKAIAAEDSRGIR